jgi:NAD(P)-dependent dehydrogenase (short-subunit alcohol dehydrogenase family)
MTFQYTGISNYHIFIFLQTLKSLLLNYLQKTMAEKRTILVTGCSDGGLGSALAIALHDLGWRVFASARNPAKCTAVTAAGLEWVQMDVGSEESIAAAVEQVRNLSGGTLDGLVNNAGGGYSTPFIHADIDKAHDLFELNVFSIIRVTRAFLPLLLKSDRHPIVANNTSAAGLLSCGQAFQGIYAASKAAATTLTEIMRLELGPFGVRVVNLLTGGVKSSFQDNKENAVLPAGSIYNVAKAAIEGPMNGDMPGMDVADRNTWAKQVAKDLSHRNPSHLIFRGAMAGLSRLATLLPIGSLDGTLKKLVGIDVLERNIKEQGGLERIRKS